jgi:hypothetical protein
VTPVLTAHTETEPLQRGDHLPPRQAWQLAHTATINAPNFSSGTGKPSSFSTSM